MDTDDIFEELAATNADREAKQRRLRAALVAAADLRDSTAAAHLEATRACNALVLRVRVDKALPVPEILEAARISRGWLYSLSNEPGGLSGIREKPKKDKSQPKDGA